MKAWRVNASGVLVPTSGGTYPKPAGWAQLPADIRAEWERRWLQANARNLATAAK